MFKFNGFFNKTFKLIVALIVIFPTFKASYVFASEDEGWINIKNVDSSFIQNEESDIYYIHENESGIIESNYLPFIDIEEKERNKLNSIGVPVPNPIRSQGVIYNHQLGDYIDNIEDGMNNVTLIGWLGTVLNPLTAPIVGGTQVFSTYLHNKYGGSKRLNTLKVAKNRGDHLYWVITSATSNGSGIGVNRMETFSNLDMRYIHSP